MANLERATLMQRALPQAVAVLENLWRLAYARQWMEAGPLLDGTAAIVCGAGPSLDRAGVGALRAASECGVMIAPQTAARALKSRNVRLDAVCALESGDFGPIVAEVAGYAGSAWLDVSCAPGIWRAAEGLPVLAFHSNGDDSAWMSLPIGAPPIEHAGSAVTAAVSLALQLGADPVVLVGCDLSYPTGKQYAAGSAWDVGVVADGDGWIRFTDVEEKHRMIAESFGTGAPPERRSVHRIACNTGGEVVTTGDYLSQLRGLERLRKLWPDRKLWNASVGGAAIAGWRNLTLDDAIERMHTVPAGLYDARLEAAPEIGAERADAVRQFLATSVRASAAVADAIITQGGTEHVPWWHDGGLVNAMVVGDHCALDQASETPGWVPQPPGVRVRGMRAIWANAARLALQELER